MRSEGPSGSCTANPQLWSISIITSRTKMGGGHTGKTPLDQAQFTPQLYSTHTITLWIEMMGWTTEKTQHSTPPARE